MPKKDLDIYFEYLKNILYYPDRAKIDFDLLSDDDHREFAKAIISFGEMVMETRIVADKLSRGQLDIKLPSRDNEIASSLKALHSTLKHLTWQARQIADGDYEQRIAFMGEFSDAINTMVIQLAERKQALDLEMERDKARLKELDKTNSIFQVITSSMEEWIVMIDRETGERLFANRSAESMLASEAFEQQLYDIIYEYAATLTEDKSAQKEEFVLISDTTLQYFEMMIYQIRWFEHNAVACVLTDVTASKEEYNRLEDVAYKDNMTGVYNRLYGMKLLDQYQEEKIAYRLIFVDMDMLKYVNDVFGHLEGDAYIKGIADALKEISNMATVCRLGGDEFMVLIQERDVRGRDIEALLEELRKNLINSSVYGEKGDFMYSRSISYGIVEVCADDPRSKSEILSAADEKMYEYKKAHKKDRRV